MKSNQFKSLPGFIEIDSELRSADAAADTRAGRVKVLDQSLPDAFPDDGSDLPLPFETWLEPLHDLGRIAQARHGAGLAGHLRRWLARC